MIKQVVVTGWVMILLAVLGGFLGFMLYAQFVLRLTIHDQPAEVVLPPTVTTIATASNKVDLQLNGRIDAQVPLKQTLNIPLIGDYHADLKLDTYVPLKFEIKYQGEVPVKAAIDIVGTTELVTQKHWYLPTFPLKVHVPLDFMLPVNMTVPVDTKLHLVYNGPMVARFNQTVHAPVNTVLKTHIMVNREITTPILASFGLRLHSPTTPVPVIIKDSDIKVSLSSLRLHTAAS